MKNGSYAHPAPENLLLTKADTTIAVAGKSMGTAAVRCTGSSILLYHLIYLIYLCSRHGNNSRYMEHLVWNMAATG